MCIMQVGVSCEFKTQISSGFIKGEGDHFLRPTHDLNVWGNGTTEVYELLIAIIKLNHAGWLSSSLPNTVNPNAQNTLAWV